VEVEAAMVIGCVTDLIHVSVMALVTVRLFRACLTKVVVLPTVAVKVLRVVVVASVTRVVTLLTVAVSVLK
jgi:hypothetical protein